MTGSAGGATDGAGAPWLQPVRDASGTPWLEPVSAPSAWSAADLERDRSWVCPPTKATSSRRAIRQAPDDPLVSRLCVAEHRHTGASVIVIT